MIENWQKKLTCLKWVADKKIYHVENDQEKKREKVFTKKCFWIKDDRDNVTRWKKFRKKRCGLRLNRCFLFCCFFSKFHRAYFDNKAWLISMTHHSTFLVSCMHHTKHQVRCLMPNLFPKVKKYGRLMGNSNRCHRKHPRRIWAWYPRDKGTTGQTDKFAQRPYQD